MILFYFLIFIMPLMQHPIWGRMAGGMTVFKYIGAACVLYALFHVAARRSLPPLFRNRAALLFLLLYGLALMSGLTRGAPTSFEANPLSSYTSFLFLFLVTFSVVDSLSRLHRVLLVAVGSLAFASLYVLREWQKYHSLYPGFRPGWVVGDANYFTVSAVLCLPIAFYLALEARSRWERAFCLGSLVLTLAAVMLAASRGGFLGLVAAFLLLTWRSRARLRHLGLAGLLLLPLALAVPNSPLTRLIRPGYGDREATEKRQLFWTAGLRMVRQHPLGGVGLGNFKFVVSRYAGPDGGPEGIAHSSYIEIAAEMGLPALLVFLALLYWTYRTLERERRLTLRSGPRLAHQAAVGMQAGLVGYAVSILFVSGQYQKLFWLLAFLSMLLPLLRISQERQSSLAVVPGAPGSDLEELQRLAEPAARWG